LTLIARKRIIPNIEAAMEPPMKRRNQMATDKYNWKQDGAEHITLSIPSGPAAGEYRVHYPRIAEDGTILIASNVWIGGKPINLKIKSAEMPGLVKFIQDRDAQVAARLAANAEAEARFDATDQQMRHAGFSFEEDGFIKKFGS
jgi:hypothetical protein